MDKTYKWLILPALLITALLWWIDDDPPYEDFRETLLEIAVIGSLFTLIFWGLFSGIYWIYKKVIELIMGK